MWTGPDRTRRGTPLPPETISLAKQPDEDNGGLPLWIPAVGLALAGAGVVMGRRR